MPRSVSQQARRMMAEAVAEQGPQWQNTANMIAAGFENLWLTPALAAIDKALRIGPDDDDD